MDAGGVLLALLGVRLSKRAPNISTDPWEALEALGGGDSKLFLWRSILSNLLIDSGTTWDHRYIVSGAVGAWMQHPTCLGNGVGKGKIVSRGEYRLRLPTQGALMMQQSAWWWRRPQQFVGCTTAERAPFDPQHR